MVILPFWGRAVFTTSYCLSVLRELRNKKIATEIIHLRKIFRIHVSTVRRVHRHLYYFKSYDQLGHETRH